MPIDEHQNQDVELVVVRNKKIQPFSSSFQLNYAIIEACCIEPRSHNILARVINWNLSVPGPLWLVV